MRSSSSRNLAASPNSSRALRNQVHPNHRHHSEPHEKFICMQLMQGILFTSRISFLMYDIVHAVLNKPLIYRRIGWMLGGDPTESEKIYTAAMGIISLFLISLIVFTFIYNYMLVHENLHGIMAMGTCLVFVFIYNVATFGNVSMIESAIVCPLQGCEIIGVFYLIKLVKHKKEVRYVQHFEKRFSIAGQGVLGGMNGANGANGSPNRQLPHQKRIESKLGSTTPPAIMITESDKANCEFEEDDASRDADHESDQQTTASQPDEDQEHGGGGGGSEQEGNEHHERRRHHRKHHHSRSRQKAPSEESESSVSVEPRPHRHSRHHQAHGSKSRDHLTVPGQFEDVDEEEQNPDDDLAEEATIDCRQQQPLTRLNSPMPPPSPSQTETLQHRHQSSRSSRSHNSNYPQTQQLPPPTHSIESDRASIESSQQNFPMSTSASHYQQYDQQQQQYYHQHQRHHHQSQVDYYHQRPASSAYAYSAEEYSNNGNYRR